MRVGSRAFGSGASTRNRMRLTSGIKGSGIGGALTSDQKRFYEYVLFGFMGPVQDYGRGEAFKTIYQADGVVPNTWAPENGVALSMTGNPNLPVFDEKTMFDAKAHNVLMKNRLEGDFYPGIRRFVVHPLPEDHGPRVQAMMQALTSAQKEAVFEALFKDFPNLRKPFQPDVQEEWFSTWTEMVGVAHNDAEVKKIAEPYLLRNLQERFLGYEYHIRFMEKLAAELVQLPGNRAFEARIIKLVLERTVKLQLNIFDDQSWASPNLTGAWTMPVTSLRVWHEAGLW